MKTIGINGLGRIGRLVFRILADTPGFTIARVNEPAGSAADLAHLIEFDSVHGTFSGRVTADEHMTLDGQSIHYSRNKNIADTDWSECDLVIDCSGKFKTSEALAPYFDQQVPRVLVSAPVKSPEAANIVVGVNDNIFDAQQHRIVSAASCTTNCLAPIVKVIHETFGIHHGSFTTVHDITNTQSILDTPHKDLRRARASHLSLIPTTTGSATAIAQIFPELTGRLNGHAIRVPLANASLTDCVFELDRATTADEVNHALQTASENELKGILGFETRPLVSIDYRTDPRSCIVDAPSTLVTSDTQVKIYAWYDNEYGYAQRCVDLARFITRV